MCFVRTLFFFCWLRFQFPSAYFRSVTLPDDLSSLRKQRADELQGVHGGTRDELQKIADATILSEQAIRDAAQEQHISVTQTEVKNFLVLMLTKQVLIDRSKPVDSSKWCLELLARC